MNIKDGYFIAFFGWVLISAISALPFVIHGSIPSFTDAFFEMMSGYTTSGATILTDIEAVPRGLLFWRSQTHLLGGMGFLTLTVIFLPHGMGGLRIFRAESSPGQVITKEKFHSRNRDTMVRLWIIYMALNLAEILMLWIGGMSLFDAMCHAFGTVSTSGYSPYNASIGHFRDPVIDFIIFNPAGFTHTSVAIRDAVLLLDVPIVEVHLSNIHKREPFRHHSYIADVATARITGLGPAGYIYALEALAEMIA